MRTIGLFRCVLCLALGTSVVLGCNATGTGPRRDSGVSTVPDNDGSTPPPPGRDAGRVPGCNPWAPMPGADQDADGWASDEGDCDDCSNVVNPGAFDFPGNTADEDCSGVDATEADTLCDTGLAMASSNAQDAARSIGLCKFTSESAGDWGVISARFTRAAGEEGLDGPLQTGILPSFGVVTPPAGSNFLALSSGVARAPNQPGFTSECDFFLQTEEIYPGYEIEVPPSPTAFPTGFPVESPTCPGVMTGEVYNSAALEVRIRVPTNARSLHFRSNFYTYEYPEYICDEYNDFFVALMSPRPAGLANDNIVFDNDNNLVSVNTSLLQVCEPGTHGGKAFDCPLGTSMLSQTGFDGTAVCGTGSGIGAQHTRAATGWLRTTAPVTGGQIITLRFTVWDSADPILDSTVLIDDFGWEIEDAPVRTVPDLI